MLFLNKQLIFILFCTIVPKANGVDEESPIMTYRPIIGVMSIDISHGWIKWFPNKTQSIAASYIKIVETGGARAVPILCNQTDEYYEKMFQSTNGLLIPGGGVSLDTSCYAQVGRTMIQKALNSGDYYPIWGTCLGFELILHILDDNRPNLSKCYSKNVSLPLYFDDDYLNKSRIGQAMPKQMKHILSTENVTSNFHKKCITIQTFYEHNLDTIWYPLSTSYDESGLEFISLIEAKNYAFWGSQFHPEKNNLSFSVFLVITAPNNRSKQQDKALYLSKLFTHNVCNKQNEDVMYKLMSLNKKNPRLINFPATVLIRCISSFFWRGDVSLDDSCYAAVGEAILKRALNSSDYYPIWGTCLGFELLLHLTDDNRPNLAPCLSKNKSLPVKFNENTLAKSTFGKELPKDVKRNPLFKKCDTKFPYIDDYGLEFISIIEAIDYPFWGTQFHPEMSLFEWSPDFNSPELHSTDTIGQAQFFCKVLCTGMSKEWSFL
ncbi:GGH [Lepeophtheirus salmonis]|uniref:folate gamma-glutamyl hydrolase n=1 Tax=Lepeophtheirus salmonis TaxID=72036 RepID=A0A7R8CHZ1_LEPSM|nr:GGH [Lepeophtheirus salmonis]CAF2827958.1 GGH [Lepeophtheirus salmonis]